MAHAVPYQLSIEPTEGESFMYGFHLGTNLALARDIAQDIARNRKWFAGHDNVTVRTVALMTADRRIVDVCEGGEGGLWHSEHAKRYKPYNLTAHANLVDEGFMLIQHEADWHDDGDGESGPHLAGGPGWDEYLSPDYRIIITEDGVVAHHEPRDLAMEAYCDQMVGNDG